MASLALFSIQSGLTGLTQSSWPSPTSSSDLLLLLRLATLLILIWGVARHVSHTKDKPTPDSTTTKMKFATPSAKRKSSRSTKTPISKGRAALTGQDDITITYIGGV